MSIFYGLHKRIICIWATSIGAIVCWKICMKANPWNASGIDKANLSQQARGELRCVEAITSSLEGASQWFVCSSLCRPTEGWFYLSLSSATVFTRWGIYCPWLYCHRVGQPSALDALYFRTCRHIIFPHWFRRLDVWPYPGASKATRLNSFREVKQYSLSFSRGCLQVSVLW